jgi:hypothetical protein
LAPIRRRQRSADDILRVRSADRNAGCDKMARIASCSTLGKLCRIVRRLETETEHATDNMDPARRDYNVLPFSTI